jgi:SAM-dependent methyltransferase
MAGAAVDPPFPEGGINGPVYRWIESLGDLDGRTAVDLPAGDGRASFRLARAGARVLALDLFPEFMRAPGVECQSAQMGRPLPLADGCADLLLCQEGIEHIGDPLGLLEEFNRVLRPGGTLAITTPSLSHLRARLAQFTFESDMAKNMPPSELDSIWFDARDDERIYFGHLFLLGAQKLLTLSRLAGFRLVERRRTKLSPTSLLLLPLGWPLIAATTLLAWGRSRRRFGNIPPQVRREILAEHARVNLAWGTLVGKHLFWVFEKRRELSDNRAWLKSMTRAPQA